MQNFSANSMTISLIPVSGYPINNIGNLIVTEEILSPFANDLILTIPVRTVLNENVTPSQLID